MKKKTNLIKIIPLTLVLIILISLGSSCAKSIAPEELKSSIELIDIETRWEKKYYQPWPPKLTLAPAISFKVKNVGEEPLSYVYFNGIFRFIGEKENLGDNFLAGIHGDPLNPGEVSEEITLQSNFGVEGDNVEHFKNNPEWKTAEVRIFAKSKGSQYILLGTYTISKKINFKEPEPVGMEEKDEKKLPSDF
ncbi:MAG: hypothetical protein R6V00_00860 [Candidatus Aminicenantes bacterium]